MNRRNTPSLNAAEIDAIQARFAVKVCSALDDRAQVIPSDISARLRASRERAIDQARVSLARATATQPVLAMSGGHRQISDDDANGWWRLTAVLPLLLLIAGFVFIHYFDQDERINAAAEVDAALLADDLPPSAYADPGFAEFLRSAAAPSGDL